MSGQDFFVCCVPLKYITLNLFTCALTQPNPSMRPRHVKPFRHAEPSQQAAAVAAAGGGYCDDDDHGYCDADAAPSKPSSSSSEWRRSSQWSREAGTAAPATMPCGTWISPQIGCMPSSTCTGCTTAPCGPCRTLCGTFCSRRGFAGSVKAVIGSHRGSSRAPRTHR